MLQVTWWDWINQNALLQSGLSRWLFSHIFMRLVSGEEKKEKRAVSISYSVIQYLVLIIIPTNCVTSWRVISFVLRVTKRCKAARYNFDIALQNFEADGPKIISLLLLLQKTLLLVGPTYSLTLTWSRFQTQPWWTKTINREVHREVVVGQLVERSLTIPEARGSSPVIGKILLNICFFIINCVEKTKINKKRGREWPTF